MCLLFNSQLCQKNHNCEFYHSKIEKETYFPQKIYKLNKTNSAKLIYFSLVLMEREEKNTKYFTPRACIQYISVSMFENEKYRIKKESLNQKNK